jgi:flagellar biosynthesis protein
VHHKPGCLDDENQMMKRKRQDTAVALKYQPKSDNAPKVTAKGKGKLAEKIVEIAKKNNIYIHNDPDLVEILSQLDINDEISPELYIVAAELLAFVYSLNNVHP